MQKKIKQVYVPYWVWEDYNSGMWRKVDSETEKTMLNKAIEFTSDHIQYGNAMKEVIGTWRKTMLNTLTNPSVNKRAFLGHCAVCYKFGIPEYITRKAWKQLTDKQRILADHVAQKTIDEWQKNYILKSKDTLNHGRKNVTSQDYQIKLKLE